MAGLAHVADISAVLALLGKGLLSIHLEDGVEACHSGRDSSARSCRCATDRRGRRQRRGPGVAAPGGRPGRRSIYPCSCAMRHRACASPVSTARTRHPGNDDQLGEQGVERKVLEVVLARSAPLLCCVQISAYLGSSESRRGRERPAGGRSAILPAEKPPPPIASQPDSSRIVHRRRNEVSIDLRYHYQVRLERNRN